MATNIPPHNLREVIDGVVWVIEQTLMTLARRSRRSRASRSCASSSS